MDTVVVAVLNLSILLFSFFCFDGFRSLSCLLIETFAERTTTVNAEVGEEIRNVYLTILKLFKTAFKSNDLVTDLIPHSNTQCSVVSQR